MRKLLIWLVMLPALPPRVAVHGHFQGAPERPGLSRASDAGRFYPRMLWCVGAAEVSE